MKFRSRGGRAAVAAILMAAAITMSGCTYAFVAVGIVPFPIPNSKGYGDVKAILNLSKYDEVISYLTAHDRRFWLKNDNDPPPRKIVFVRYSNIAGTRLLLEVDMLLELYFSEDGILEELHIEKQLTGL